MQNLDEQVETVQNCRPSEANDIQRRMSHGPNLENHSKSLQNRRASVAMDAHMSMMKERNEEAIAENNEARRAFGRSNRVQNLDEQVVIVRNRRQSAAHGIQQRMSHGPNSEIHFQSLENGRESVEIDAHRSMMKETKKGSQIIPSAFYGTWLLLKDRRMFCYCIVNGCFELAFDISFMFLQEIMTREAHIPRHKSGTAITILGLFFVLGKLLTGIIVQFSNISPIVFSFISMLCLGSLSLGITFCLTYEHFAITAGAYGLMLASFGVFNPFILIEFFGNDNLSKAYGLLTWLKMPFVLMGPPVVGAIIDFTGNFKAAFYVSGSFQLVGGLLNIIVFIFQLKTNTKVGQMPPILPK